MKRALVSVSDKANLVPFVQGLVDNGYEIVSTGGTKRVLDEAGISTISIEDVTHFPEILDGRVKTLNPYVHGGLLARRELPEHMATLEKLNITPIDLVCVNLYPFKETIEQPDVKLADAIENIDIGGPSMVRSAAKNYRDVTIVVDRADYDQVLAEIEADGDTYLATRTKLAAKRCATGKTATRRPGSTRTPCQRVSQFFRLTSSTGRSCPTTTLRTLTRPCGVSANLTNQLS